MERMARRRLGDLTRIVPRWLRAILGVGLAIVGVVLIFRPFTSLTILVILVAVAMVVTGVVDLAEGERWTSRLAGAAWIVGGVLAVIWPGLTTQGIAVVVGVAMIVGGVLAIVGGFRGTRDERLDAVIGGAASVVFGALTLAWPDVTLLVVAIVFGARTFMFGVRTALRAIRHRDDVPEPEPGPQPPGPWRRFAHVVVASLALLLALALSGVSATLHGGEPYVDEFYATPDEPPAAAGTLLRSASFDRGIPEDARGWRILYTTTRDEGVPAVASAIVVVPEDATPELPVIAMAHGTTGVARACAPSVLRDPFGAGAFFVADRVIDAGWALVATDYVGLGTEGPHPYLVGQAEARSVLDAVRAARQLEEASLGEQTVVWGHSQGGGATLWTGQIAPTYAPDVPLAGVAALAPASDLLGLVDNLGNVQGGSIFATYVLRGYASAYPDVRLDDYVTGAARTTFDRTADTCLAEPEVLVSVLTSVATDMSMFSAPLGSGTLAERLAENVPTGPIAAPVLIAQGDEDGLVLRQAQDAYVERLCASGQAVEYRTYPGLDHVPLVQADSPLIPYLFSWTTDRLAGEPAPSNCPAD